MRMTSNILTDVRAATAIQYGLIAALVSAAITAAAVDLGKRLEASLCAISAGLGSGCANSASASLSAAATYSCNQLNTSADAGTPVCIIGSNNVTLPGQTLTCGVNGGTVSGTNCIMPFSSSAAQLVAVLYSAHAVGNSIPYFAGGATYCTNFGGADAEFSLDDNTCYFPSN